MIGLKNIIFASGFMALGGLASVGLEAVAQPGKRGAQGGGHALHRLIQDLDLNSDQQSQLEEMRDTMRTQRQQRRLQQQADHELLFGMLGEENVERDLIHEQIDERMDAMRTQAHAMADDLMDIHASLDADQRAVLVENAGEMRERREQRSSQMRSRAQQRIQHSDDAVE